MKLFTLKKTNGNKAFCSELCFTQCRRASFKKNKVCDWCKHVRHTVNYVDFQDGDHQLQFCSDKCLNQYRMNIFCTETQAHIQMYPHLKEATCRVSGSSSLNLITPDLWLQDCKTQRFTNCHGHKSPETAEESDTSPSDKNKRITPFCLSNRGLVNSSFQEGETPTRQSSKIKEQEKVRRSSRSSIKYTTVTPPIRQPARSPSSTSSTPHSPISVNTHGSLLNGPYPTVNPHQSHASLNMFPSFHFGPDKLRNPVILPNMYPSSLNLVAQQQMESLLRMQHGLGIRPSITPLPVPPGLIPPIPPLSQANVSSSIFNSQPSPFPHVQTHNPFTSSLLPPVTIMVPCPIPFPIPIPVPFLLPVSSKAKSQLSTGDSESETQSTLALDGNNKSDKIKKCSQTEVSSFKRVDSVITKLISEEKIQYHSATSRLSPLETDNPLHFSNVMTQPTDQGARQFEHFKSRNCALEPGSTDDDNFTSNDSDLGGLGTSGLGVNSVNSYSFSKVTLKYESDKKNVNHSASCYNSVVKPGYFKQKRSSPEDLQSTYTSKRKCIQENSTEYESN
ncbi:sine oculis-binding protein homolog isoform X2 [Limulus polyphemus]|nr:sine oculis-binding protein homolog isoform X2 [Limulus polyphemus]